MLTTATQYLQSALDLIYPRQCIACGDGCAKEQGSICWSCFSDLQYVRPPFCSRCGTPVAGAVEREYVCQYCTQVAPGYDSARAAVHYDGVAKDAVTQLKYSQAMWVLPDLAALLEGCYAHYFPSDAHDIIVPVPLHSLRRRARGFNQASLLGKLVARKIDKPLMGNVLYRLKDTQTQTNLTASQRLSNVRGAFAVLRASQIAGTRVLLVDDVMTTGATASECARILKVSGATTVDVLTVARRF